MEQFPILYDEQHRTYLEDIPFWISLAEQYGNPVLELGCGTGRVLFPLQQAGHETLGLDRDQGMLRLLCQKHPGMVICADMTDIPIKGFFRLVILPCNTYLTLHKEERKKLLECVARIIHPDGIFAVSLPNPWLLRALPESMETDVEEIIEHPSDGNPVQISNSWQRSSTQLDIFWHYDHLFPDGTIQRLSIEQSYSLQPPQEYEEEFKQAGFEVKAKYGNFDQSPFQRTSPNLIFLIGKTI